MVHLTENCPALHIEPIDPRDLLIARQIHAVLLLAHAQEAMLLQIRHAHGLEQTPEDIQASTEVYLGAFRGGDRGGALVGAVSLRPDDEPAQINVAALVVHPQYQRQGIGRALMLEALRRGKGTNFSVATGVHNLPALALYRSLGFVEYRRGILEAEAIELVKLRRLSPRAEPSVLC